MAFRFGRRKPHDAVVQRTGAIERGEGPSRAESLELGERAFFVEAMGPELRQVALAEGRKGAGGRAQAFLPGRPSE